ncbi:unnamed protein product [Candida verbasci]|uniref:L-serine ammonia-lyase n=1 Tax=Candida verbasci TaxID=1227364 RepID=A0A9W4TW68_9ASCO|nr:unnamed protein product [Candida verbasci]
MDLPSIKTSFVEVTNKLPRKPPCKIYFKNEFEQPSGSFKLRGMGYLIYKSVEKARAQGKSNIEVFCSSGGNAGLAAAYASAYYNLKCTVVLPIVSKKNVIEKLEFMGAKVIIYGKHWGEADNHLKELIKNLDNSIYPVYAHPFDDELIWQGHSQILTEIINEKQLDSFDDVKGVVCSVGGGGLYNGMIQGLNDLNSKAKVLAIETLQTPTFHETIKVGKIIHLEKIETLSNSLGSPYMSKKSFENYNLGNTKIEVLDDLDGVQGTLDLHDLFGYKVEPACGVSVATVLHRLDIIEKNFQDLKPDDIIIILVCGGSGINDEIIDFYRQLVAS